MTLIERIHEVHNAKGIHDEACCLCVAETRRREAQRPAWFANLRAKDMTRGVA